MLIVDSAGVIRMRAVIAGEIYDTIRGVRRMIRELLPSQLDGQLLWPALDSVFRDAEEVYGLTVHVQIEPEDYGLDGIAALALYLIIQEAVVNAARHARVSQATVILRSEGDRVIAEIRDVGCGFKLPPVDDHVGLAGMRERAALAGGIVTIESSPGKGTAVRAIVPTLAPEQRDGDGGAC